ncbi:dolichol-phosphate mannosyltransferase [Paenibacillus sophorae]|uniref:Dolichol-phosphate mannosyltransferase n=1 Tax=Paenibacillus sophorae TaxID=1333845 RepID=A0A1H8I0Z3_9BACL|nr:glycosyltransferase family 2 protein [Paenibacillus sophorae]QWU15804.1 glycosyltransferase family 2 protein [Paenibacillus sophorae]SEN61578.1 dolichol-phosphate mannosyltransferase [Paenibacillus sophorae]
MNKENWQVPNYAANELNDRSRNKYCVCIPVINEGEKIQKQLKKMAAISSNIDIIILDGGSTDNSLNLQFLEGLGIKTLLVKKDSGKLSAQLRMGFAYALEQGYEGVITVDGNNKDSVESIPSFIEKLDEGYDFVQGSRYVPGGSEINTPLSRKLAIKLIHAPVISLIAGFRYTDTTNGFRAHSRSFLLDPKVQPFRNIFSTYELLAYLSVRSSRLGYRVIEIPVTRAYPKGKIPTKISPLRGNMLLMKILFNLALKKYNPESNVEYQKGAQSL